MTRLRFHSMSVFAPLLAVALVVSNAVAQRPSDSGAVKDSSMKASTKVKGTKITMQISGAGALDESTIKSGKPVSFDIYWENGKNDRRGFATGFKITSDNIKNVIHVPDSGNGLNDNGDIKGHNGWETAAVWDLRGILLRETEWNGKLPDTVGFAGFIVKNRYNSHPNIKVLSLEMIIPDTGTIVIDSTFFPPGGTWEIVGPKAVSEKPIWGGPYSYHVVR